MLFLWRKISLLVLILLTEGVLSTKRRITKRMQGDQREKSDTPISIAFPDLVFGGFVLK